jgi:glutaredoxin
MATLTLFGKPGCHLCEEARTVVRAVADARGAQVVEVDVTRDPVLERRYGERIPVLTLGDEELFEFVVDGDALGRRLDKVPS